MYCILPWMHQKMKLHVISLLKLKVNTEQTHNKYICLVYSKKKKHKYIINLMIMFCLDRAVVEIENSKRNVK